MLYDDPTKRITSYDALQHEFFQSFVKDEKYESVEEKLHELLHYEEESIDDKSEVSDVNDESEVSKVDDESEVDDKSEIDDKSDKSGIDYKSGIDDESEIDEKSEKSDDESEVDDKSQKNDESEIDDKSDKIEIDDKKECFLEVVDSNEKLEKLEIPIQWVFSSELVNDFHIGSHEYQNEQEISEAIKHTKDRVKKNITKF